MGFLPTSKLAKIICAKAVDDWKSDIKELSKDVPMRAIILTEIDKKHIDLPVTQLHSLFHEE